jgi:hypothetical protein
VAAQSGIIAGVKHGEPHHLIAQRWRVLEQHDILTDSRPAPGIDLTCDVIGRYSKGAKLGAMDSAALAYGKAAELFMMVYPCKHGTSLEVATSSG